MKKSKHAYYDKYFERNWNNIKNTWNEIKSLVHFKNNILKFIRPSPSNVFNCNKYKGIRLITRLRVGVSHFCAHKFKHSFQDCLNPICSCGLDIKSTSQFLLHCPTSNDERYTLLSTLNNIDCKLLESTKSSLSQTLLYDNTLFNKEKTHGFLTQQLNMFYPLKDSRSLLFS